MDYYSYLYNELWSRGYDVDNLASHIYQTLNNEISNHDNTSSVEMKGSPVSNTLNDILDGSAPDYLIENHQLSEILIYYFKHQNEIPLPPRQVGNEQTTSSSLSNECVFDLSSISAHYDAYSNHFLPDDDQTGSRRASFAGVIAPLDNNLDDMTIDSFRCIDLSVNAASFEPSSSYTSSQSYLSSKSDSRQTSPDLKPMNNIDDVATDSEDFSCFETDLSFSLGYLESVLYYKLGELPANAVTTFSDDAMELALFLSNLDVFAAADIIIYNANAIASSKPCLHARNGGKCFRRDCMFDHDFNELTCKFWFSSVEGCQLHDCPFLHGLKVPEEHQPADISSKASNASKHIELTDEELFPSLSSSHHQKMPRKNSCSSLDSDSSTTSSKPSSSSSSSGGNSKAKEFDPRSLLSFTFKKNPTAMSAADVLSGSSSRNKSKAKNAHTSSSKASFVVAASTKDGLSLRQHYDEVTSMSITRSTKLQQNAWVESGSVVAHMYHESREEARKLALMRNRLLEEATRAYVAGSKDVAKNLSKQGQALNQQMKELHLQAARRIFHSRNPKASLSSGQVDLHGLHVSEAKICVQELIPYFRNNLIASITIVTGTGHHTLGPQQGLARVLPAVVAVCDSYGLKYQEVTDRNGYVGGLKVKIHNS